MIAAIAPTSTDQNLETGSTPTDELQPETLTVSARDSADELQPDELQKALREVYGFNEFRAHQREAVETALSNRDVLVVMPTGAGKSLCFQLPAAITDGLTLVISPLVALMRDQVLALKSRTAFSHLGCAYLNSLQGTDEQREVLEGVRGGTIKLLYVAPERFRSAAFLQVLSSCKIARFVVDEAHCISEWGHDFRPDYLGMRAAVEQLGRPPLMAVTATATKRVQESIVANLGMRDPQILVGGFNRPNLHFSVHRCKSETERDARLERALPKLCGAIGSGLIYVSTRKQCEHVAGLASRALAAIGKKAGAYHAGLTPSARNELQAAWLCGELPVLVATNAFGMGIDKPDVRFVIHYGIPDSLEAYYQEAGRAGRDGRKSRCVVLTCFGDRRTREWFIENEVMQPGDVKLAHTRLCAHAKDSDIAYVARDWWRHALDWNEIRTRLALRELEREKLVLRVNETADETVLKILQREFPADAVRRIRADLEAQRDERYRRLEDMLGYCKTTNCRRFTLLGYFGDEDETNPPDFCCDNCERNAAHIAGGGSADTLNGVQHSLPKDRVEMLSRIDGAEVHQILQGIDALRPRVGKARLNKILRGANARDVEKFRDENCPLFGVLRGATQVRVDEFLEKLIEHGLLHQADEDDYFVCSITTAGRETWQLQTSLDIISPLPRAKIMAARRTSSPASTFNGSSNLSHVNEFAQQNSNRAFDANAPLDEALFDQLRDWRRGKASAENLPPYCVLSDRTLREIAAVRPASQEELCEISGIGPAKWEKYGDEILQFLKEDTDSEQLTAVSEQSAVMNSQNSELRTQHSAAAGTLSEEKEISETIAETYLLLQSGLGVEEIAAQRELKVTTIWSHLETLLLTGTLEESALQILVDAQSLQKIEAALEGVAPDAPLKPVWEQLNGEFDYGVLRCVRAVRGPKQEVQTEF